MTKHPASMQKAPQAPAQSADVALPAGPDGAALAPPAYGLEAADRQPIQRSLAPATTRDSASGLPQPNRTGLPDALKADVEALSGLSLDDVRVHLNSSRPAQLQALAYTQGNEIHVAPGQERHLPHEAWHVVQQRQGRVRATRQLKGTAINDDAGLEHEADVMGRRAAQLQGAVHKPSPTPIAAAQDRDSAAVQRAAPVRVSAPFPAGGGSYKLVAGMGERAVGSVMVHAGTTDAAEVTDLSVEPAHRAQGIGRLLIASAARTGQQLGKATVALAAQDTGSGRLTRWYKRMGFAQVGKHQSGYPQLEAPIGRVIGGVMLQSSLGCGRSEQPEDLQPPVRRAAEAVVIQPMMGLRSRGGGGAGGDGGRDDNWSKKNAEHYASEYAYGKLQRAFRKNRTVLDALRNKEHQQVLRDVVVAVRQKGGFKVELCGNVYIAAGLVVPRHQRIERASETGHPRAQSIRRLVTVLRIPKLVLHLPQELNEFVIAGAIYDNEDYSSSNLYGEEQNAHMIADSMIGSQKDRGMPTIRSTAYRNQKLDKAVEAVAKEFADDEEEGASIVYVVIELTESL
jgi:ribosomal protein S18 acetylase RimI-like enzyme